MTHVYLTNAGSGQSFGYYIRINAYKIEWDFQANINTILEMPKGSNNQGNEPVTYFIDLQQRAKIVTIYGIIDMYSRRTSSWTPNPVNDVGVIRKEIEYMWGRGKGVLQMYIGYGEGYCDVNGAPTSGGYTDLLRGEILKFKVTEMGDDHVLRSSGSEDYPQNTNIGRPIMYDIILTFRVGERKG